MRKFVILAIAAVVAGGLVSAARAESLGRPCTTAPESQWLPLQALQGKIEAQGYTVKKAKLKSACAEIYALDKDGKRVELFLDPTSGEIAGRS